MTIAGIAGTFLTVAACSASSVPASSSSSHSDSKPQSLVTVRAAQSFPYASGTSACVLNYGESKGFFAKNGVNPVLTAATGSVSLINEVGAGQLDIGYLAATPNVIEAVSKGASVKIVATMESASSTAVISSTANPIRKPADLAGKKVAYDASSFGAVSLAMLLKEQHMSLSEIDTVNVQSTLYASALKSGSIDGFISFPASAVAALQSAGVDPVTMSFRDFGVNLTPADTYIASDALVTNHPEVIKEFLKAAYESFQYVAEHPDVASEVISNCQKTHPDIVNVKQATAALDTFVSSNSKQFTSSNFMDVSVSGLESQAQTLKDMGQVAEIPSVDKYYAPGLAPAVG
jgi:NitT/TauT family transport system substrate-binding protein